MEEIPFKPVPAYRCDGCERLVTIEPCPACLAREAAGPSRVDALLLAVGHNATVRVAAAVRAADRADP